MGRGLNKKPITDARSTGRKRAQKVMKERNVPIVCGRRCDGTKAEYSCWKKKQDSPELDFDVNHINRNILDNDPTNLEFLCRECHYKYDRQFTKGDMLDDSFGYTTL